MNMAAQPHGGGSRAPLFFSVRGGGHTAKRSLASSGGGGSFDGMETRVAKLEAGVSHLERDVGELRTDVKAARDQITTLVERVSHLPSKGFIVSVTLTALLLGSGIVTIAPKLQALLGTAP